MPPNNKRPTAAESINDANEEKKIKLDLTGDAAPPSSLSSSSSLESTPTRENFNLDNGEIKSAHVVNTVLQDNYIGSKNGRVSGIGEIKYTSSAMFKFDIVPYSLLARGENVGGLWYRTFLNCVIAPNPQLNATFDINEPDPKGLYVSIATTTELQRATQKSEFLFTHEQRGAYESLIERLSNYEFSTIMIVGPAGCGKTVCLQQLIGDKRVNFQYITMQTNLAENAKASLNMDPTCVTTVASFCMRIFRMAFPTWVRFHQALVSANPDVIDDPRFLEYLPISWDAVGTFFKRRAAATADARIDYDAAEDHHHHGGKGPEDSGDHEVSHTTEYQYHVLCLDEFSMIPANLILLLKKLCGLVAARLDLNLGFLLCGDAYQIEPLFITKTPNDDTIAEDTDNSDDNPLSRLLRLSRHYLPPAMSDNAKSIISAIDVVLPFCTQMRNDNIEYQTFISSLRQENSSNTCRADISRFFGSAICHNRTIEYIYPIEALKNKPIIPNIFDSVDEAILQGHLCKYATATLKWLTEYGSDFSTFRFFSFTNSEAHQINLCLFSSIVTQTQEYNSSCTVESEQLNSAYLPRVLPILFTSDMHLRFVQREYTVGPTDNPRLPLLPLIIGMEYKLLSACKTTKLKRGQVVTLVDIIFEQASINEKSTELSPSPPPDADGEPLTDKILHLVVVAKLPNAAAQIILISPCHFRMNLFRTDNPYHFASREEEPRETLAMGPHTRSLYGFPVQLNVGDTIRGSIGITVSSDIYANLNGSSISEIYVLLSRTRDANRIRGLKV